MMSTQIAVIGAGRIGANIARQLSRAGHQTILSFSRNAARLQDLATDIGHSATVAPPAEAVARCAIVVVAVPWPVLPDALDRMGDLTDKVIVDTTNQFGSTGLVELGGTTAAAYNAERMAGARYTKCFNTLTAQFQVEAAHRPGEQRVVQWICGNDPGARATVAELVEDAGYAPLDLGDLTNAAVMEPPRRDGAVYGEEYRLPDAVLVLDRLRAGRPIPPPPQYT